MVGAVDPSEGGPPRRVVYLRGGTASAIRQELQKERPGCCIDQNMSLHIVFPFLQLKM